MCFSQLSNEGKQMFKKTYYYLQLKILSIGKFNYVDLLIEGSMMKYEMRRQKLQSRRTENIKD